MEKCARLSCGKDLSFPRYVFRTKAGGHKILCSPECYMAEVEEDKKLQRFLKTLLIVLSLVLFLGEAKADHYGNVSVLAGKLLVAQGQCSFEDGKLYVPCEQYTDGTGAFYLVLWTLDGKHVAFVRKYNADGTFENVYSAPNVEEKIFDSIGARKI